MYSVANLDNKNEPKLDSFLSNIFTTIVDLSTEICIKNKTIILLDNIPIAGEYISKGTVFLTFNRSLLKDDLCLVNKILHNKNGNVILIVKHDDIYSKNVKKKDTNIYYLMANDDIKKGAKLTFKSNS